jgi:LPXTG-motif cell wall-anchored protein
MVNDQVETSKVERNATSSDKELENTKGVELPSTGGMGTTIFYIIGAILVVGAGIVLVTRRRMSAN